jgi:hypothetical protein
MGMRVSYQLNEGEADFLLDKRILILALSTSQYYGENQRSCT